MLPLVHTDPSLCTRCCQWPSVQKDLLDAENNHKRKYSLEYIYNKDAQTPQSTLQMQDKSYPCH